jgi:hypothetical protein
MGALPGQDAAPQCVATAPTAGGSGRYSAQLLLGAVPILFMMSVLAAALDPEAMRKLRNLFTRNRDWRHARRGGILFRRVFTRLGGYHLDGLCHAEILLKQGRPAIKLSF